VTTDRAAALNRADEMATAIRVNAGAARPVGRTDSCTELALGGLKSVLALLYTEVVSESGAKKLSAVGDFTRRCRWSRVFVAWCEITRRRIRAAGYGPGHNAQEGEPTYRRKELRSACQSAPSHCLPNGTGDKLQGPPLS
jgi:hypothetical protein